MNAYLNWLKEQGFSDHTTRRYVTVCNQFIEWFEIKYNHIFSPNLVTAADLQEWKTFLLNTRQKNGKKYAISTVNNNIESIKSYFRFLHEKHLIPENPSLNLKKQAIQQSRDPKWLDQREEATLRFYIDHKNLWKGWQYHRNRAIIYTMLFAGLRISEVSDLEVDDLSNGFIHIRNGKGKKARKVYMNKTLASIMEEWLESRKTIDTNSSFLFISQKGGQLTESGIEKIFDRLRKKTGLEELTAHVLRHTCGHNLILKGSTLNEVADILGHNKLDTTRLYTHSSIEEQKKALDKLE